MNKRTVLVTIGYEGIKPKAFLEKLKEYGISFLVDVRQNPNSRKQGFSKYQLETFLQDNKINYIHLQELGTPPMLRKRLKEVQDYDDFFEEYENYLRKKRAYLTLLKELAEKATCCLMCFEKDYQECHRKIISSTIRDMADKELEVIHI